MKGAAATALYGARAKDGAIVITTKKGKKNSPVFVTVNSSTRFENVLKLPDFQNEYAQGSYGVYNVKVSMLGVIPVSQTVIVGNKDGNPIDQTLKLDSPNLIKGLAALLPKIRKGERVDAIIPYQLGYGDRNYPNPYIPLCSTLQFTFTVKSFD